MTTPYYQKGDITIYHGGALEVLKERESESVDMVMTSPPYWGLRDYQSEPQIWQDNKIWKPGNKKCNHTFNSKTGYCVSCCCNAWKGSLGL